MKTIESTGILLPIDNIDTDQIIPAQFLKSTSREGFGKNLFFNWRYLENGEVNPNFAFHQFHPKSEILIAGNNFGCGSSREHAAWAIADYGIKAVISSQFADIFKGNALNNGILPIELSPEKVKLIMDFISSNKEEKILINLEEQTLGVPGLNLTETFQIDPLKKEFLLKDLSEIEYLIQLRDEISEFEQTHEI